jgi:hypothetical protein
VKIYLEKSSAETSVKAIKLSKYTAFETVHILPLNPSEVYAFADTTNGDFFYFSFSPCSTFFLPGINPPLEIPRLKHLFYLLYKN